MDCGRQIRCWDNTVRPCVRKNGHTGHCNPFSDTSYEPQEQKKEQKSMAELYKQMAQLAKVS